MKTRSYFAIVAAFVVLFTMALPCCNKSDDGDDDDDSSPEDIGGDDTFIDCEGADFGGSLDEQGPDLVSLELRVNGVATPFPAVVRPTDQLEFVFEYVHPICNMMHGYPFIIVDSEAICLSDKKFMNISCTSETEGPATVQIAPSYFLNGDGAPYGFEISDIYGNHSNRLPVEIVTTAAEEKAGK